MLFTKSAPVVSRSAFAAKTKSSKFWGTSNQPQAGPAFFVSTPQFTRHQATQVATLLEDSRGTGNSGSNGDSYGIDNPYLALTAGANTAAAAPATVLLEDETKDEVPKSISNSPKRSYFVSGSCFGSFNGYRLVGSEPSNDSTKSSKNQECDYSMRSLLKNESDNKPERYEVIDGMLRKMRRLQLAGSHKAVLSTFEDMESIQDSLNKDVALPIEAYNMVLISLASSCNDVNIMLEAYEKMLSQGLLPNNTTYTIILNTLTATARRLAGKKSELEPLLGLGDGTLESVEEIYEGLAVEEHLILSQEILQAVISSNHTGNELKLAPELQSSLNELVNLCMQYSVEISSKLLPAVTSELPSSISVQSSLDRATERFGLLSPELQKSQQVQEVMLHSYFRFKHPSGALAFYSGCGAPRYLLSPLLKGLSSLGLVGVARRWVEESDAGADIVADVLKSVPLPMAKKVLPSATQLFYKLAEFSDNPNTGDGAISNNNNGGNGDKGSGRCSYIRLCISAENPEALFMAIRESKFHNIMWDAVTTSEAIRYLVKSGEPLLAADISAWQVPLLAQSLQDSGICSFVGEELIADTVRSLKANNQLSLDAALRLLPVVMQCLNSRKEILDLISSARLYASHDVAALMDSNRLNIVVSSLASFLISGSLRATKEELGIVSRILPLFLEDSIVAKVQFTDADSIKISEALKKCGNVDSLIALWEQRANALRLATTNKLDLEMSRVIQRYALAPNGFDYAIDLLKDQIRLKKTIAPFALEALMDSCIKNSAFEELEHLFELLPHTPLVLNLLAKAAVAANNSELAYCCHFILVNKLEVWPDHSTYLALISCSSTSSSKGLELYKEAIDYAHIPLNSEIYNSLAIKLAQDLRKPELAEVLAEMKKNKFHLHPPTYGHIINMSVRMGEGHQALAVLKGVPEATKSLLEVKVFNHLMHFFVYRSPDRQAALDVFMELRSTGTLATSYTYRLLMEAYLIRDKANEPSLSSADKVLSLMRQDGTPITTQCFATLLRARGVLFKDFEGARNFYRGMVKNSRVLPDRGVFKALMESYVSNGKQAESGKVLEEMKRYHVPIDQGFVKMATS